jgi:hypothetical protein
MHGCGGKNAENRNKEEGKNDKNDFRIVKLNLKNGLNKLHNYLNVF